MIFNLEQKSKNKIAAIDAAGNRLTYGQICQHIADFVAYIGSKKELAIIICRNDIPTLLAYLSCLSHGIVPLLLSYKSSKETICRYIDLYSPSYIFCHAEDNAGAGCQLATKYIFDFDDYCLVKLQEGQLPPIYDELSLLLVTSGSTGSPKTVRFSYGNLKHQAQTMTQLFGLNGNERIIVYLPFMYCMAITIINCHLDAGATILLTDDSLLAETFWQFFKAHKGTGFLGVPYSFEVLHKLNFSTFDLPHLNMLSLGGGKLDLALQREFAEYILNKGGKYIVTYGQTESTTKMACLPQDKIPDMLASIGKAVPGGKLYLKEDDGHIIETPNTIGELYYEGANVTLGYAENRIDLAKGDEFNGVLATGDMAYMDENGFFFIAGRKKRFLKLFGHRIDLDSCEVIIREEFKISCACFGNDKFLGVATTDATLFPKIKALIVQKTQVYPHTIKIFCLPEIPRSPAGKILYSSLDTLLQTV